jgi:hypothetical protein
VRADDNQVLRVVLVWILRSVFVEQQEACVVLEVKNASGRSTIPNSPSGNGQLAHFFLGGTDTFWIGGGGWITTFGCSSVVGATPIGFLAIGVLLPLEQD